MSYGAWLGALGALGISGLSIRLVKPKNWQRIILGRFLKGNSKIVSLTKAIERHPKLAKKIGKNHNFSDALNLADYCKIYFGGKWNIQESV